MVIVMLHNLKLNFSAQHSLFFFFFIYSTVLVLPYINMNPPWVYISSHVQNRLFDSVGEGEGRMIWDDGIETQHSFKLSIVWMFGSLFSLFYYSVAFPRL